MVLTLCLCSKILNPDEFQKRFIDEKNNDKNTDDNMTIRKKILKDMGYTNKCCIKVMMTYRDTLKERN